MTQGIAATALAALQAGRIDDAMTLIERGVETGDAEAVMTLGLWRIEGRWLPRDLTLARAAMAQAAEGGHIGAARIYGGLLATGVGGARDWDGALALLDAWAARDPVADAQARMIAAMDLTADGNPAQLPDPLVLSTQPYIHRFSGLLTAAECALLVSLGRPRLKPARIFHEGKGQFVVDPLRTSDAAGFPVVSEWPFVHAINRRFAAAGGTDVAQGEPLQLLRYRPGEEYKLHLDAVPGLANQRTWTVLAWLGQDYRGGETHFPRIGLRVEGRRGDALVFANVTADGRPDPLSEHAGLAVTHGEKLMASRWIRAHAPDPDAGFGQHEAAPA